MNNFLQDSTLGQSDIILALGLILLALSFSKFLKLKLEKDLFIAAMRTTVQLVFVGLVLKMILAGESWIINFVILLIMSLTAAQAVVSRLKFDKLKTYWLALIVLTLSVWPIGVFSILFIFNTPGLIKSALFIPFMGVLLGNTLTAISLSFIALEKLKTEGLKEVETFKALGADSWEACLRIYKEIMRSSMTPILNGMTIVGVVSLPGVMAGQLLGGIDPLVAARFQILIMFLMALASLIGAWLAIVLYHYRLLPEWIRQSLKSWQLLGSPHEIIFLTGPSGSGKSRLLKSFVGLDTKYIREAIKIKSDGVRIDKKSNKRIFYLPQKPYFTAQSVEENLMQPFQFKSHQSQKYKSSFVLEILKEFKLSPKLLHQSANTLSGGEAQIFHLIRTLQLDPEVLMLDEPTASLDLQRTLQFENFLKAWLQRGLRSLVVISHNQDQIKRLSHKTIYLENSQLKYLD